MFVSFKKLRSLFGDEIACFSSKTGNEGTRNLLQLFLGLFPKPLKGDSLYH